MEKKNQNGQNGVATSAKEKLNAQIGDLWTLEIFEERVDKVFDTVGTKEEILDLLNKLADKYDAASDSPHFGEVLYNGDVCDFIVEHNGERHCFFIRISSLFSTYEESDYDRAVNDLNEYLEYNY